MKKDSFVLYKSLYEPIKALSTEEKGVFLDAIFKYQLDGTIDNSMNPMVRMAFLFFKNQFDLDAKKYEDTCNKRAEIGRKGGLAKATKRYQKVAKGSKPSKSYHNDNEKDNEKDNDIKSDSYESPSSKKSDKKTPKFNFSEEELLSISKIQEPWDEYLKVRKKNKQPHTERALRNLLNKLIVHSVEDQIYLLDQAIEGGWKSIDPESLSKRGSVQHMSQMDIILNSGLNKPNGMEVFND